MIATKYCFYYISVGKTSGMRYLQRSASVLAKITLLDVFSSNLFWKEINYDKQYFT